jgi:phage-related protein
VSPHADSSSEGPSDPRLVANGLRCAIRYAEARAARAPARDFLEGEVAPRDQATLGVLFSRLTHDGKITNEQKFRHLEDGIFEFKSRQVRILAFQSGRVWYLTHGFIKKQQKTPRREIDRAKTIRSQNREIQQ